MSHFKKKILLFFIYISLITFGASFLFAQVKTSGKNTTGNVNITFNYKHLGGWSSNQFAVWIEDAGGKYIKTLYVTRFTARGGWKKRPDAVPVWVKSSDIANLANEQIDSISGATPDSGKLAYTWDCTDINGNPVHAGEYKYIVEGTLRRKNRVIYTGTIKIDGVANKSTAISKFFGDGEKERGMITTVAGEYQP